MTFVNLDLVESSRSLAVVLLELSWIFEDLYVPEDPEAPINQAIHDDMVQVLRAAHIRLTDYVARAQKATEGAVADERRVSPQAGSR